LKQRFIRVLDLLKVVEMHLHRATIQLCIVEVVCWWLQIALCHVDTHLHCVQVDLWLVEIPCWSVKMLLDDPDTRCWSVKMHLYNVMPRVDQRPTIAVG
jgi:hypothetical protein